MNDNEKFRLAVKLCAEIANSCISKAEALSIAMLITQILNSRND